MYKVKVNGKAELQTELRSDGHLFEGLLNGKETKGDLVKISEGLYHLLYNNKSYTIQLVKKNQEEKTMTLRINSVKVNVQLRDKYDELLHRLGLDEMASRKVNDVKAPMPGMVLNILVGEGTQVKKGDALLVLEAMKMENIIKSPCDGVVKRVAANKGTAVEKNQLLIQF
jgi:biotin carboxyl carrier protein